MRKLLLVAIAALALHTTPAAADLPVIDVAAVTNILKEIGIEGQQLDQLVQTYTQIVNIYQTSQKIWSSVSELVGADQWAPDLQKGEFRNGLPVLDGEFAGWVNGMNDPSGLPHGPEYLAQVALNGCADCFTNSGFHGDELHKEIFSLAWVQAMATNHLDRIGWRITALNDLFTQLSKIGTIQETDSLSARFNSELNYATGQVSEATQLFNTAQMQVMVRESRQRQFMFNDEYIGIVQACNNAQGAGAPTPVPACTNLH